MPRPCKCRFIAAQPQLGAFKPAGVPGSGLESIELGLDELEALRLADLEGLYHDAAAERMRISRATFGRLIECARHKVACAIFHCKILVFHGGTVIMRGMRTFECVDCGSRFGKPHGTGRPASCPKCRGTNFCRVAEERGGGRGGEHDVGVGQGQGRCRRRRAGWSRVMESAAGATVESAAPKTESPRKENE